MACFFVHKISQEKKLNKKLQQSQTAQLHLCAASYNEKEMHIANYLFQH